MRRGLANLGLLVASLVLAVLLVEALLRVFDVGASLERPVERWPWLLHDPIRQRRNVPGFTHRDFRINSLGFRGPEIERRKQAGTVRIVCLGDSATFGVWNEHPRERRFDLSYPEVLASLIEASGMSHVEVINAGVLGHTTEAALRQLVADILPLDPDVITVRLGNNDHKTLRPDSIRPLLRHEPVWRLMRLAPPTLFGWKLTRLGFRAAELLSSPGPTSSPSNRVPPREFGRNLRRFVDVVREQGLHLLLIDFPYRPLDRGDRSPLRFPNYFTNARSLEEFYEIHDGYQAILRAVAAETETPLLDTQPAFAASPVRVFSDHDLSHPNEAGIRTLADLLFERLRALGWLRHPSTRAPG